MPKIECMECQAIVLESEPDNPYCEPCLTKLIEEQEAQVREQEHQEIMERVKDHPKFCDCFICVHY